MATVRAGVLPTLAPRAAPTPKVIDLPAPTGRGRVRILARTRDDNLDVLAEADWVVDLGPEGGSGGGKVVAEGTPEQLARTRTKSHTAKALGDFLALR